MPDPKFDEELLTFSHLDDIEQRVYYTLSQDKKLAAHRTAKAVGKLFQRLHAKGVLKKKDIDVILRESVY